MCNIVGAELSAAQRYLVDTDQEVEGLAVIADFQGKALDDTSVQAEYKEIRDAVLADVRRSSLTLCSYIRLLCFVFLPESFRRQKLQGFMEEIQRASSDCNEQSTVCSTGESIFADVKESWKYANGYW